MPIFNSSERSRLLTTWSDFKTYINGTSASLLWNWTTDDPNTVYQLATEPYLNYNFIFWMPRTGSADQTDFENNFKNQGKAFAAQIQEYAPPTFIAFASGAGGGELSLFNSGNFGNVVKIQKAFLRNTHTLTASLTVQTYTVQRITGHSGGGLLTIYPLDTNDTTSSNITARVGASYTTPLSGTTNIYLDKWKFSTDRWVSGTADSETISNTMSNFFGVNKGEPQLKKITLRANEGISFGLVTGVLSGFYDLVLYFTVEPG